MSKNGLGIGESQIIFLQPFCVVAVVVVHEMRFTCLTKINYDGRRQRRKCATYIERKKKKKRLNLTRFYLPNEKILTWQMINGIASPSFSKENSKWEKS